MKKSIITLALLMAFPVSAASVDTVIHNAKIYTVDSNQTWATSMVINNGVITAIGSDLNLSKYKAKNKVNANGQFIMPSFISSHLHPAVASLLGEGVQLIDAQSPQEILERVKAYSQKNEGTDAILGFGWWPPMFGDEGVQAKLLDTAVNDRPVLLIAGDAHNAWANTKALEVLGIDKDTPDPQPNVHYYKRDKDGNPTGWLVEGMTFWTALKDLNLGSVDKFTIAFEKMLPALNAQGITALFDAGIPVVGESAYQALVDMDKKGKLPLHYRASHYILTEQDAKNAFTDFSLLDVIYRSPRFRMNAVKISNDGTIEAGTAALSRNYKGHFHSGSTQFSAQELLKVIEPLDRNNIPVMIHAIGDRTSNEAVTVLSQIREKNPKGKARHSITHLQLMSLLDMKRMAKHNIIAQVSPVWAQDVNGAFDTWKRILDDELAFNQLRFASMFKAGITVSMGSDYPASGVSFEESAPLYEIEVGMTRRSPSKPDSITLPSENEKLALYQLIKGYTINSAYQLGMEKKIGSLEVGKQADYIILDKNLFEINPRQIHKTKILETVISGKTVYKSD